MTQFFVMEIEVKNISYYTLFFSIQNPWNIYSSITDDHEARRGFLWANTGRVLTRLCWNHEDIVRAIGGINRH